jgi:FAD/FMN-containing dehydrogenase
MSFAALLAQLRPVLGPHGILEGDQATQRAAGIWRSDTVQAPVIFRPENTAQVAEVLKACWSAGQAVVTHGGLTGLVEGALTDPTQVVLSTERLNRIEALNESDRSLCAQAGVTLQAAQAEAQEHGLMLAIDLGARGTCTLGGNAATNAGGHQVLRYGMTRESILGLEVVLADGTVLNAMNGMLKNNAGYDLKQLFIGSEGTLGIITRLMMRLRPASTTQETALVACENFAQVSELLNRLDRELGGTLTAFEVMWQDFYALVADHAAPLPARFSFYVLVEALGTSPANDAARFVEAIANAQQAGQLVDAVVAKSGAERDALWQLRDSVEKTLELGPAQIFDVSLPLSAMAAYVGQVKANLASAVPYCRSFVFGHAGDGNLHIVCVHENGLDNDSEQIHQNVEEIVYRPLSELGGSVSGEHGIGREKKQWLPVCRTAEEVQLMRQLKSSLDPRGILNPGLIFD